MQAAEAYVSEKIGEHETKEVMCLVCGMKGYRRLKKMRDTRAKEGLARHHEAGDISFLCNELEAKK